MAKAQRRAGKAAPSRTATLRERQQRKAELKRILRDEKSIAQLAKQIRGAITRRDAALWSLAGFLGARGLQTTPAAPPLAPAHTEREDSETGSARQE